MPDASTHDSSARLIVGDSLAVLQSMPDASVDFVLGSPPFFKLRNYLDESDPEKAREVGHEPTPGEYVDRIIEIVEECARVLTPHGSVCIEVGDKYFSSSNRARQQANANGAALPLNKSLALVPELLRLTMIYGRNPLTGRETPQWRARNVVRWARPNPPAGSLGDKFRPATSDMIVACKSNSRYFDLHATRKANGAPPLDWWEVTPEAYAGAHDAVWPTKLLIDPIRAMTPRRVCTDCGKPAERIVHAQRTLDGVPRDDLGAISKTERAGATGDGIGHHRKGTLYTDAGWTDCGHNAWRNGVVLDPWAGSGTTLQVATGLGVDAIGIELKIANADLAFGRLGMFLDVEDRRSLVATHKPAPSRPVVNSPRQAEMSELDRLFADDVPRCYAVFDDMHSLNGYIPSLVFEGVDGHFPLIGGEGQTPWYWGHDIAHARTTASRCNAELGISESRAHEIVTSSVIANIRTQRARENAQHRLEQILSPTC